MANPGPVQPTVVTTSPVTEEKVPAAVRFGLPLGLLVIVSIAFAPSLHNDFVAWDDDIMITDNPHFRGLSPSHLAWMLTTFHAGHYEPLSWLSLALDYTVWGMNPVGYHLTNLLLHAMAAVVFYGCAIVILRRAFHSRSHPVALRAAAAMAAAVFAIHPLRVECVAWATSRRDVLSGLLYFSAVLAYVRAHEASSPATGRKWLGFSLGSFALSLLADAWGMTLPVVLLALDIYPLGRFRAGGEARRRVLLEKVPFVGLGLAAAAVAALAAWPEAATLPLGNHGAAARLAQATYGLVFYCWKTVFPFRLSPLYLLEPHLDPAAPRYVASLLVVIGITAVASLLWHRWPWLLLAWLSYVFIVSPVLGLLQSGPQIAADRYTYLASAPFALLLGAASYRLWLGARRSTLAGAGALALVTTLGVLGALTFRQTMVWRNSATLWTHAIEVDPSNYMAYTNRAWDMQVRGDQKGALSDLNEALRINPEDPLARNNRGALRQANGDLRGALEDYEAGLRFALVGSRAYVLLTGNMAPWKQELQRLHAHEKAASPP